MKYLAVFLALALSVSAHQLGSDITGSDSYTLETNNTLVLKPDGANGVEWGTVSSST